MSALSDSIKDSTGPKIIVCCGSGGVGKTTISAAMGLYGAVCGKKTIVLTIDPAKRLADSLGLKRFDTDVQKVPLTKLHIGTAQADLYAMMLDPKSTFDRLVARYVPAEYQKNIFKNRYYHHLSNNMAGSHEYMAMEMLYEIFNRNEYDLIVLDTPPSRRALDFLEAPQRMLNILGHNFFMRMFRPYLKMGRWGIRFLNILASPILKSISKMLGKEVLEDFAGFMQLWDDLMFEGFSRRATAVKELLAGSGTLFLAVTSPQRLPMDEAIFFYDMLVENQMPFGAFIVNRVNPIETGETFLNTDAGDLFVDAGVDAQLKEKMQGLHEKMREMGLNDARSIERLKDASASGIEILQIPVADDEIIHLDDLYRLLQFLEASN